MKATAIKQLIKFGSHNFDFQVEAIKAQEELDKMQRHIKQLSEENAKLKEKLKTR